MPPSPVSMMESTGYLQRGATGRDAQQGTTQTFETISPVVPCSVQPASATVQLLYKQRNSDITTIVYLAQDIGAQVSDRFVYTSPGGETGTLLVLAQAQQVNRGVVWKMDCMEKPLPSSITAKATRFTLSVPADAIIGAPIVCTIEAVNAIGDFVATYSGTVAFYAFTDPLASLPSPTLITGGIGSVTLTFNTLGNQVLVVQDVNNVGIWGEVYVPVVSSVPSSGNYIGSEFQFIGSEFDFIGAT